MVNYLELKYSLLMSYSTYLTFYALSKIEGNRQGQHPVLFKLAHIKQLLDQLAPIDDKIEQKIAKIMSG